MKKKENLWELLRRLDEEAGEFNLHLHEANRYFDSAALATKKVLVKHEKRLHTLIGKVQKAIKAVQKTKSLSVNRKKKQPGSPKNKSNTLHN